MPVLDAPECGEEGRWGVQKKKGCVVTGNMANTVQQTAYHNSCVIASFARNFLAKGVEAVYKQSQIVQTFLSVRMYRLIFHSFPGVKLRGTTFEAKVCGL